LEEGDTIERIAYFTAFAPWKPESIPKHKASIDALSTTGVEAVMGHFQKVTKNCKVCGGKYKTYEEKKTDVQLSVHILRAAFRDDFEKMVLVSGDSDQVPTLREVFEHFPDKQAKIVFPPRQKTDELCKYAHSYHRLQEGHLRDSLLPETLADAAANEIYRPSGW
jgi:hypothetical protein